MKNNILRLFAALLPLLALGACNKDEGATRPRGEALRIKVAMQSPDGSQAAAMSGTRASDNGYATTFETGDAIGIYVWEGATLKLSNHKWTLTASGWAPATEADAIYNYGPAQTLRAYYPYDATAAALPNAATFTVQADQSTEAGYRASDLLLSADATWRGAAAPVTLAFAHAMALVEAVPQDDGSPLASVTLEASAGNGSAAATIKMRPMSNGTWRAAIPAQTLATQLTFDYGAAGAYAYDVSKTVEAGKYYRHTIATTPFAITMTDDGNGTAAADAPTARAGTTVTVTATPANADYRFKEWQVVGGGVTLLSATTTPATFTMPAAAVGIKAVFELTPKAAANAEAAKITGFTAGTNNQNNLVFDPVTSGGTLAAGATLTDITITAGASSGTAVPADFGASGAGGKLSLNTQKTVDATDLTYVGITFAVTLNGTASDPISTPIDISSLFGATTTAGKLRADKAKIPKGVGGLGKFSLAGMTPGQYYALSPTITLSSGVSIPVSYATDLDAIGIQSSQISIKADEGSSVMMAMDAFPNRFNSATFSNFRLNCGGTYYMYKNWVTCLRQN